MAADDAQSPPSQRELEHLLELERARCKVLEERVAQLERCVQRANECTMESHRQLLYADKMAVLGALVAGIAHEIKTPIGAISSMQDTLLRALDKLKRSLEQLCPTLYEQNKQLRGAVGAIEDANKVIESGSSRVLEIVARLRNFARVDAHELHQIDIHTGLEETLMLLHHELKNRIQVVKDYECDGQIRANGGQINQVFLNLLVNSAQAISERGTIRIRTQADGDAVVVTIEDDGVGIPPEHMQKLFEPGFTTKGAGIGTGLGLAICQKIVLEHHGQIDVQSTPGAGTKVIIRLPREIVRPAPPCGAA